MSPIDIMIICVYVIGIVLLSIGFGIWQYDNDSFSWWDDAVPFSFLVLIWPILPVFVVMIGGVIMCFSAIALPIKFLMRFGKWLRVKYHDRSLERERKKREEKEQKEKDIQHRVKKMQKAMKKGRNRK